MAKPTSPPIAPTLPDPIEIADAEISGNRINTPMLIEFMRRLIVGVTREFRNRSADTTPRNSILLLSPNGKVYSLTVGDTGTVTTSVLYNPP